jgi:hypothetical protein
LIELNPSFAGEEERKDWGVMGYVKSSGRSACFIFSCIPTVQLEDPAASFTKA